MTNHDYSFTQAGKLRILDDRRPVAELWSWKGRVVLKFNSVWMILQIAVIFTDAIFVI